MHVGGTSIQKGIPYRKSVLGRGVPSETRTRFQDGFVPLRVCRGMRSARPIGALRKLPSSREVRIYNDVGHLEGHLERTHDQRSFHCT